jgi:eukaryotic-like serine/threonine-protein kinase
MPFSAGTRVGPYEILTSIGVGGMGEVWKARDTRLNRLVAIKQMKGEHSARFEQEARAIAALNHPNICQIHDIGPDYLVLEYIDGVPLKGPLAVEFAVPIALQIASALEAAHHKGILHRDLKPANVLITEAGAKLLDFGLAKLLTVSDTDVTGTVEGTIVGTAAYMSPEQAGSRVLDERSDVFSFGAVVYEMLAGARAFKGASMVEVLSAVIRDEPAPLNAPEPLTRMVTRCLRKAPADRFQSMAEVRAALERYSTERLSMELISTERFPTEQKSLENAVPVGTGPSIAVLPFANLSADKENEYFSDGLAEEVINLLAHIPGLKVIARTSAFAFRGQELDVRKIAEALNVRTVLEGSVRKSGSRVRVNAQLISAEDGSHLWSERYDREMADVFDMQDEIASAISGALHVKLSVRAAEPRPYTPKLPAYEALLRARHHFNKVTPDSMARTRECLEQAIALDPGYALAHSELGVYFSTLATYSMLPAQEAMPLARAAAEQALNIDPSLPDALATLGTIAALYDYNWTEAARLFKAAMARDPAPPRVRQVYAFYLHSLGQSAKAIEELQRSLEEDPLNLHAHIALEFALLVAGRASDASRECGRILELDENHYMGYFLLSIFYAQRGKLVEAVQAAERAHSAAPWAMTVTGFLAGLLMRGGDPRHAAEVLQKLGTGEGYNAPYGFVYYWLLCSEVDQAAYWVQRTIEQRSPNILAALRLPLAADLRSSARWPALAKMMNLPDAV